MDVHGNVADLVFRNIDLQSFANYAFGMQSNLELSRVQNANFIQQRVLDHHSFIDSLQSK
ncbi:hypothetical protein D3C81_1920600 [compost metagenome]